MPLYLVTVSGEIPLKSSRTRSMLYSKLLRNIRRSLKRKGITVLSARILDAKILVETSSVAIHALSRVFGVHRVSEVQAIEFTSLEELAGEVSRRTLERVKGRRFAVRVKRSGVHSFTSLDVAREVGALLKPYSAGVDLENPEVEVTLEIRGNTAYLHENDVEGPGGFPISSSGRALVLFSGGFDSPVAAWMAAKRGLEVDFLHYVMGSSDISRQAFIVARKLSEEWLSSYNPKFIIVDFTPLVAWIEREVAWSYRQVVLRALMYMVADRVAGARGYDAVVTGESLAQASSQTLANLKAIEKAASLNSMILRPLIGLDKEEIISYSRQLGLYEYSSKVAEACAIAPRHTATRISVEKLKSILERIENKLLDKAVEDMRVVDVHVSSPEEAIPEYPEEIDYIPSDSVLVDARSIEEYKRSALPGALHVSMVDYSKLPRDRPVVFYCDTGGISRILAAELRSMGFKAYSLKGGLRRIRGRLAGTTT
ncbi:MAG: tRNA 4-thiouridine(8) synthase ThiI [Desulfurococcus sp.]|nr:tRNA 4-thiouridine(8) synthase ThiI [Desulfurococcus sp.]